MTPVSTKTQDRPLLSVYETRVKKARTGAGSKTRGPHKTYTEGPPSHSSHSERRSQDYHAKIIDSAERTRAMNPSKISPAVRTYPGLAN